MKYNIDIENDNHLFILIQKTKVVTSVTTEEDIQIKMMKIENNFIIVVYNSDDDTSEAEDAADDVPGVEPGTTIDMDEGGTERLTV